jgi:hypothetical protein
MEGPLPPLVVRSRLVDEHKLSMWRCHPVDGHSEEKTISPLYGVPWTAMFDATFKFFL